MKLRAYNKRLGHTTKVVMVDVLGNKVKLLQPDSSPEFYYTEELRNVELLEFSGITLHGTDIYAGDQVKDTETGEVFSVLKRPGGFTPFVMPIAKKLRKV